MNKIIMALGSNTDAEKHLFAAKRMIENIFSDVVFSSSLLTEPIGIDSDKFLNCLAVAFTELSKEEIEHTLKRIERDCGDNETDRKEGKILMDIDILEFEGEKYHIGDWERDYVKTLMKEIANIQSCFHDI